MKKTSIFLLALLIQGCSQSTPKCSDSEVVSLLKSIVSKEIRGGGSGPDSTDNTLGGFFTVEVSAIRNKFTNEKTGNHECTAQVDIDFPMNKKANESGEITYTVEMLDNGKEFYVKIKP